jgi:hypothetical protein
VTEAISLIWKLSVLAELAVAARLLLQGLAGQYPALVTACCVLPVKSLLLMYSYYFYNLAVPQDQLRQLGTYLYPLDWGISAWIVFELFSRWTRSYRGIGRFGKYLLVILLAGALLVSVACWHAEWAALVFAHNFRIYYLLNRVVFGALALFTVGTWLFFRSYPVAIAPNVFRHTHIAVVYFVTSAASLLVFTLNGLRVIRTINLLIVVISAACFCAWAILMTRRGEVTPMTQRISVEDKDRIEHLNAELLAFMGNFPKLK